MHEGRAAIVVAFAGGQRADRDEVLELLGDLRHVRRDLDAVSGGFDRLIIEGRRFAVLEVPEVDRRRAAAHPEDHNALVVLLKLGLGGPDVLNELHARQSHGREASHVLQEVTPILHVYPRFLSCSLTAVARLTGK